MKQLNVQRLSREAFADYGSVIEAAGVPVDIINAGTTRRHSDLARLDLLAPGSDPVISIYEASARVFPLRLHTLERHSQASQVFLPLGPHRFIVVVAPGAQAPQWDQTVAFLSEPGQGICLRRGCWHHGLISLSDDARFAVIEGGDYRNDTVETDAPLEIVLQSPG
ncbi:MAG: ureidoglycolate lyase [Lautropia sp.]